MYMSLNDEKFPKTDEKHVGIEIECYSPMGRYAVSQVFTRFKLEKYVQLSNDGSIEAPDTIDPDWEPIEDEDGYVVNEDDKYMSQYTYEIKVLAKQSELRQVLIKVGAALKEIQAGANESCGLHVHLDMRNRPLESSIKRLLNMQTLMLKSVPSHRRGNTYCKPVTSLDKSDLLSIGKYHTIHTEIFNDLRTVEIRVHEGTVDVSKIFNWCTFLIKTVDGKFAERPLRTPNKLPIRVKKYITERIKHAV